MTRGGDSAQHRASQAAGESFESWVDIQHEVAGLRGILAHVVHNQARSRVVNGRLIFEAAGVADYSGVLHGGGCLASEAKSTAKERLARSEITAVQQAHLGAVVAAGGAGLAFLLVEFRGGSPVPRRYAILWNEVPWKVLRTAESLDEADIPVECLVPYGSNYLSRYHQGSSNRYRVGELKNRRRVYSTE